jgi:hypothetical protein
MVMNNNDLCGDESAAHPIGSMIFVAPEWQLGLLWGTFAFKFCQENCFSLWMWMDMSRLSVPFSALTLISASLVTPTASHGDKCCLLDKNLKFEKRPGQRELK